MTEYLINRYLGLQYENLLMFIILQKYMFVNLSFLLYLMDNVMYKRGTSGYLENHFHFTEKLV